MPLREFECLSCRHKQTSLIRNDEELKDERCKGCGSDQLQMLLSTHGDYQIKGDNSASQRPRKSRSTE